MGRPYPSIRSSLSFLLAIFPQVMVMSRSPMLRSLALSLEGSPSLTLIIPDTLPSTIQLLVSLLYGTTISVSPQAFAELSSLCTSLDLHDWLCREVKGENIGDKSTGSCEVELKETGETNKEEVAKSVTVISLKSDADEQSCKICGKRYLNEVRLERHYNSAHFNEDESSTLIIQQTRRKQKQEQETKKATNQSECASPRLSPTKRKQSWNPSPPTKILRSETYVNVGLSQVKSPRSQGSNFQPWKLQEVEEGRDAFRWQNACFNRGICQNKKMTQKQKEFCCLWNNFLWIEVHLCITNKRTPY